MCCTHIEIQNSNSQKVRYVRISDNTIPAELDIIEAAKYIVENLLPIDNATTFYIVSFPKNTTNFMIAQKLSYGDRYAAFILFGYGVKNIIYRTKSKGIWDS